MADAKDLPMGSPGGDRQLRARLLTTHQDAVEQQYSQLRAMRGAATACGFIVLLLGALGLLGRITGLLILGSFIPGGRCMPMAAAFSLVLLGLGLVALSLRSRVPSSFVRVCAGLAILAALARLGEHLSGAGWGVEDLFLTRFLPPTSLDTGYLELGAATLAIIGVAFIAFTWPQARMGTMVLAIAASTLGTIVCLSYFFGRPLLSGTVEGPIALTSAIAIVALGVGLAIIVRAWGRAVDLVTEAIVEAKRAELARLSESFERQRNELEALLSSAPSGITTFDRQGRITRINPAGQEMLGRAVIPGTEKTLDFRPDIVDEQGQPVPLEAAAPYRALQGERVSGFVVRLLNADRGPIWVSASAVPLYDVNGDIDGALLLTTDITALREAREAAQRSADELQTIMDYAPAGIIFYDPKGNIRRMNETARAALGMTDEMMGQSAQERFAKHDIVDEQGTPITPTTGVVAAVLSGADVRNVVVNFRNTPRGSVWLSVSGAPLPRRDGSGIDGVVAAFSDVTKLHEAQEKAQQVASELETLLASIADGVAVYDAQGRVARHNPAADRILQYPEELKNLTWQERYQTAVPLDERGNRLTPEQYPLARALSGESVVGFTMRFQLLFKGDDVFTPWLSVSAAPVHHDGEAEGAVMVLADISRLRQVEEELVSYRDHLEKLVSQRTAALEVNQQRLRKLTADLVLAEQSERQRLAGVIHDEIAQSLGVIKLRLQMLQADERAAAIAAQLSELIGMTANAITESRTIMVELSPPILQKEGLVAALQWWAEQVREKHHLAMKVAVPSPIERLAKDLEVAAFQAAKELIQNTVKHAHATQVDVSVACSEDQLTIEVTDNGVGFNPAAAQTVDTGSFGLFSVRERMAYLGGDLRVESAPGNGTHAFIVLPVRCLEHAR